MPDKVEIAKVARAITVIEARLIAARYLRLTDRVRLLESEKRRLENAPCSSRDRAVIAGLTPNRLLPTQRWKSG